MSGDGRLTNIAMVRTVTCSLTVSACGNNGADGAPDRGARGAEATLSAGPPAAVRQNGGSSEIQPCSSKKAGSKSVDTCSDAGMQSGTLLLVSRVEHVTGSPASL